MNVTNRNKNAQTQMWWIIIAAVIAVVASIFLILWFRGSGEKAFGGIGTTLDSLGDCDGDQVANFHDKCPYDAGDAGNQGFAGCPLSVRSSEDLAQYSCEGTKTCTDGSVVTCG